MLPKNSLLLLYGATLLAISLWPSFQPMNAQGSSSGLTGQVSSPREGRMEGVLVTAKRAGSTISTTVVSGADGSYTFPHERLQPGQHEITIRASGYVMPAATVDVAATGTTTTLTQPVRELTAATRAMARGKLDQRVAVRSRDELGQLATSFNQMSADLAV